jgi:hypothetical protein
LEAGIGAGILTPIMKDEVLDGYTPFNESFGLTRARIGLVWRP